MSQNRRAAVWVWTGARAPWLRWLLLSHPPGSKELFVSPVPEGQRLPLLASMFPACAVHRPD